MIEELKQKFLEDLAEAKELGSLEDLKVKYLGRKGEVNKALEGIKGLEKEAKAEEGKKLNLLKKEIEEVLDKKIKEARQENYKKSDWLDITAPGAKMPHGHLHPRTQVIRQIENIFISLGFSVVSGPELETQWYNFESLNVPNDHPSRDMQDTFYVKNPAGGNDLVLRTHTSPNQIRFMEKNNPPLKIIVPGRIFRNEATDASHEFQTYQVEGLMVDKNISVANFKAVMEQFLKSLYGQEVKILLRPSFFPFTEPSFEVDVACVFCGQAKLGQDHAERDGQKGCRVCKNSGWIEMGGAGMVNQKVFENAGYARNEWQGFAFGFGLDRLTMFKYRINDIRLLTGGDIRFLKQF